MRVHLKSTITAAVVAATLLPLSLTAAEAMPFAQPLPLATDAPAVILASGGCGPFAHRGFYGGCRPNGYGRPYGFYRGYHRFGFYRGYRRF